MSYRPICDTWILARSKVKYYGAYPAGFPERARALLGVGAEERVLHACSGRVRDYPYDGISDADVTLDISPEVKPDICTDMLALTGIEVCEAIGKVDRKPFGNGPCAVLIDPPYTAEDAAHYGDHPPPPSARQCLTWGLDVLTEYGGRVGILHYVAPRPPAGVKFVALVTVFVGFENRARLYSVYEKS